MGQPKQINHFLPTQGKTQALTTLLPASPGPLQLTEQETAIIQVKYKSKTIGRMDASELDAHVPGLLVRIHAITGWILPTGPVYNTMEGQFRKLLQLEYHMLNPDEIEHAFLIGSHVVPEYGKNLNLAIINQVLQPYLTTRYEVSCLEERVKTGSVDDGFLKRKSDDWFRGWIQVTYNAYLTGLKIKNIKATGHWYDLLAQDGFIQPEFYRLRFRQYQGRLLHEDAVLVSFAKIKSVHQLFRTAKKQGKKCLYQPNQHS